MERYQLKEEIWWVGAIDWNVRDFHGYETPRGTTYNAYLITDEKKVLVDGVRSGFGPELLRRVRACCEPREIDYLVVNHVEMDHSGAIPSLMKQLGDVQIFCSRRAKDALLLLYHGEGVQDWDITVVGTGDELSIGRYTLTFLEVPMLHWPDSMLTYVKEPKVLLSNDGFGQHLASSRRFADEVGLDLALDEAAKYYANILMPFGNQVQKLVKQVGELGLEFDVIAPSHGVIWRRSEDVARVIEAYVGWSRFEAPARVALVFDTMWQSTEKMTRAIEDGIAQEGVECSVFRLNHSALADVARAVLGHRAFVVGSPTLNNGMLPTVGAFLTYIRGLRPKNRLVGAYGSYGWGGGAAKLISAGLEELGLDVMDPLELKYVPTEDDLEACVDYGREVARRVKAWGR
ncbi:MAG: FprA family A-type flavoprotein [Thermoleophilia bacterium]|nr:FprA family A-type flavoprotein [Thermoleophilia bacterium]